MSAFFQKTRKKSYDLFSGYSHYVPGIMGTAGLILLLMAGFLMGNAVVMLFQMFFGNDAAMTYGHLLAYPVMFIPPMAYARRMAHGHNGLGRHACGGIPDGSGQCGAAEDAGKP